MDWAAHQASRFMTFCLALIHSTSLHLALFFLIFQPLGIWQLCQTQQIIQVTAERKDMLHVNAKLEIMMQLS